MGCRRLWHSRNTIVPDCDRVELFEVRIRLEGTSSLLQMPTTSILTMIASTLLPASWLGYVLMATFGMLQSEKLVSLWQPDIYRPLCYFCLQLWICWMIAWTVLAGLGNGIMTSMGPVLYSDGVYQGSELGTIPTSKSPGALTLWRRQNIIYEDTGISIAGLVADRGILLVCAGGSFGGNQGQVPETLTIARLTEDEIHVQLEVTN
jgi:hypothetical protein